MAIANCDARIHWNGLGCDLQTELKAISPSPQATGEFSLANLNGDDDSDTFNIGSTAPVTVDSIGAALTINGNNGTGDVLNVNDTGDSNNNTGTLTATTISGHQRPITVKTSSPR